MIIDIADPRSQRLDTAGGKGASLARTAAQLPVPPWIIVAAEAYRGVVQANTRAIDHALATLDQGEASARIQTIIREARLPDGLAAQLSDRMDRSGLDGPLLAVRSSGTLEDLPGAAFAGQHDTVLGVRGVREVIEAVRDCWASLWHVHAMRYRERLGLGHREAAMAVVVQRLVTVDAGEAAGVAFSVDPVRGSLDEVLVNAAFGLGETVVGGEEPVDEFRLRRVDGGMVDERIAKKPAALVSRSDGGVERVPLDPDDGERASLGPEELGRVVRLAVMAEELAGFPQDIEWAFSGGELYLLQSRPITRVAPRWTRDESAERFPQPVTPLTWDLVSAGFHASLNHSFALMGLPPFADEWFARRDGYIYGNQTAVDLYSGRMPTALLRDADTLREALPDIARRFGWVQELPVQWSRDLDTYLMGIGALAAEPLENADIEALWSHVLKVNDLGAAYFLPNIAISLTQRTLYGVLLGLLRLALDEQAAQQTFDALMAAPETKTGQVNRELWDLSRMVRAEPELLDRLTAGGGAAVTEDLAEYPDVEAALSTFLGRHGHRELDFDAHEPTWIEAPHIVLDQLRVLAARPDEDRPGGEHAARAARLEAELAVLSAAPAELRYLVQEVIRLARVYTTLDDLEHYQTTRLTPVLRRGLRALGERLVEIGVLPEPMDVFFLPRRDLEAAVADGSTEALLALREVAEENRAAHERAREVTPDWVHGEEPPPPTGDGQELIGTAGSPGQVSGAVFVVHGPEDFAAFPAGAILVARTTNPAWTALFYQASGVITESGGALSHGAVTARELGLPAVMAIRGATNTLRSGETVHLDGSRGIVSR